jgi:hypothetical protein
MPTQQAISLATRRCTQARVRIALSLSGEVAAADLIDLDGRSAVYRQLRDEGVAMVGHVRSRLQRSSVRYYMAQAAEAVGLRDQFLALWDAEFPQDL